MRFLFGLLVGLLIASTCPYVHGKLNGSAHGFAHWSRDQIKGWK